MEFLGATPFAGFSALQIAGIVALYMLAFFLKGVFGYGAVAALVTGGSLIIPPHHAVILAAIANFYTQIQFLPESFREGDRQVAGRMVVWVIPAIAVGVWLFARTGATGLSLLIGMLILFLVLTEVFGLVRRVEPLIQRNEKVAGPVASTLSGLIAGFIGAGGVVFLAIYIRIMCPEKVRFRATVLLIATIFVFWRALVLTVSGLVGLQIFLEALILAPIAFLAGHVGSKLMRRIPNAQFFRFYQALLIFAAGLLIWQGLTGA